jgi:signal transduction histidine kinase
LATEMAHELTKPLTHIMNAGSQLGSAVKGRSRESIKTIEKEVQRASEILDGFAMLSPDRTLHRIAVPLADLVEESIGASGLNEDGSLRIVREYEALPPIFVNPGQMVQVFTNLIQNAWHAMPEGGRLSLTIRGVRKGQGLSAVEVSIADTGHGIPAEIQNDVFKPFFTTKMGRGGRGMGLTISRSMVERHGGSITIQSPATAGRGTRVTVRLPVRPPEDSDET